MVYSVRPLQDPQTGLQYRIEGDLATSKVPNIPYDVRLHGVSKSRQKWSTHGLIYEQQMRVETKHVQQV